MKAYINRADKIADGQYDDKKCCGRVTKIKSRSGLKKRIMRGFRKSARQQYKQETAVVEEEE